MNLIIIMFVLIKTILIEGFLKGKAILTHHYAYPSCCEDSHIFNKSLDADECFKWIPCGKVEISEYGYRKSINWFKHYDVVKFYAKGYSWYEWRDNLAGKMIHLTKNNITINAIIANPCQDIKNNHDKCYTSLCSDCLLLNSTYKYLVNLEYFTASRHFEDLIETNGIVDFELTKPRFRYIGAECQMDTDCNIFQDLVCFNNRCVIKDFDQKN